MGFGLGDVRVPADQNVGGKTHQFHVKRLHLVRIEDLVRWGGQLCQRAEVLKFARRNTRGSKRARAHRGWRGRCSRICSTCVRVRC